MRTRGAAVLLALTACLALPAAAVAYVPPSSAILKRVAQHRADVGLSALEARGTLLLAGAAARPFAAPGAQGAPRDVTLPGAIAVKTPGKCRIDLAPQGAAPADRLSFSIRGRSTQARGGLEAVTAARALVETVCALLGDKASGASGERTLAQRLAGHGVGLGDVAFGHDGPRVAWVVGGRPQDQRPQAWFDKETLQPVRLVAPFNGSVRDVRLLDFGVAPGSDAFPRTIEVWNGQELEARFTTERLVQNPKLPDASF